MDPRRPADTSPGREEIPVRGRKGRRRLAAVILGLGALLLAGCQVPSFGAYKGATRQGRAAFQLWQGFFIAGLMVGGFVLLLILWAIFRYRRRSDAMPVQTQYHTLFEIIYTVCRSSSSSVLFVFTVVTENQVTPSRPIPVDGHTSTPSSGAGSSSTSNGMRVIGQTTEAPTWCSRWARRRASA